MNDNVQKIKERLDIVDVVSGYLRLQKAGINYKALCPFHNEKTPSLMISPSRQSWYCFGCSVGGDIFTFVEKIEGVEFSEALKTLAQKAGVILRYEDPKLRSEKDRLYEICEKAAQFFTSSLTGAFAVSDYLKNRSVNAETINEWRMGYAPDSWSALLSHLLKFGFREAEIEKAGLTVKSTKNAEREVKYYDRFRNRLMFPIADANGRIVAFSGRTMNDVISSKTESAESGKYINSPETALYNKSGILYGLDKAKIDIRKADCALLVEGQMDAVLARQDGISNVVATSGTALTESHLSVLKRLTGNLILAFDIDEAGFKATKRGVDLANAMGFSVSVLEIPSGKDPADFVKEKPGELINLVASRRQPIMAYYFNRAFDEFFQDGAVEIALENKKIIATDLLSEIKRLPSVVERSHWIRELSLRLGVAEEDLREEMTILAPSAPVPSVPVPMLRSVETERPETSCQKTDSTSARGRLSLLTERLLALLLKKPKLVDEAIKASGFFAKDDAEILNALSANGDNFSKIRSAISIDLRPRLDFLYLAGDYELDKAGSDFNIGDEIKFLIKEIEREHYKEKLQEMGRKIIIGEAGGENVAELTDEFQKIFQKIHNLNKNEK